MTWTQQEEAANPFTPVFGKVPTCMAGRKAVIGDVLQALDSPGNDPNLMSIFVGARGTGKTSLLSYFAQEASARGWAAANVTSRRGMLDDVLLCLDRSCSHLLDEPTRRHLTRIEIAPIGGIEWQESAKQTLPNWRSKMNAYFDQLESTGTGILITADEVNPRLDEMIDLVTTVQHFIREGRKVALLMAGLPHSVSSLISGEQTSFLRRASRHNLGSINSYEVEEAFRATLAQSNKGIDDDAMALAVQAIGGFPYMFQLVGFRSWRQSLGKQTIDATDATQGIRLAHQEFQDRVLDASYAELSNGDREFLEAMLQDDGQTPQASLASRLGKKSNYVSTYKRRLLEQGLIEEPRRGLLRFALPGLKEYLEERSNS